MSDQSDERAVVQKLYDRFAAHDGAGMAALYAENATFSDPVFPALSGREVGGMWRMLTKTTDLVLTLDSLHALRDHVWEAVWTARYTFSATGKSVVNHVTSEVTIESGKIVTQRDQFDFRAWQRQALGFIAAVLGWTGIPGNKIKATAASRLAAFLKKDA